MLSIIIPTLNEEKYIGKLLSELKPQMGARDEIIMVDSYSSDNTVKIAKKFGVEVLMQPKMGIGLAKTFGAKAAKNDIIVFMDADSIPSGDLVKRIRVHFLNKNLKAASGLGIFATDSKLLNPFYKILSFYIFHSGKLMHTVMKRCWTHPNISVYKKDLFFSVGGYRSVICEDVDMMKRLPQMKGVVYDEKLRVFISDRRFRERGFFRTLILWHWGTISAIFGRGLSTDGYRDD